MMLRATAPTFPSGTGLIGGPSDTPTQRVIGIARPYTKAGLLRRPSHEEELYMALGEQLERRVCEEEL
jgi:hypothetical protein